MKVNVRASLVKSDAVQIMKGESSTHYTTPMSGGAMKPPMDELPKVLRWAKNAEPTLYKNYVNADSSMFHNLGKKNHEDTKAVARMVASYNAMRIPYLEQVLSQMEA